MDSGLSKAEIYFFWSTKSFEGCSVCCVYATAAAPTKTNPPKKKTVRLDDGTDLGLL